MSDARRCAVVRAHAAALPESTDNASGSVPQRHRCACLKVLPPVCADATDVRVVRCRQCAQFMHSDCVLVHFAARNNYRCPTCDDDWDVRVPRTEPAAPHVPFAYAYPECETAVRNYDTMYQRRVEEKMRRVFASINNARYV